ncbi:MAG: gyrA [Defluviitaleaceae bacterium]|jgi:DNA gyrase subunit A|uniref:DNA gyrase subunit A n=1 Tax=Defluviitalea raffinosedens TaxID=1450156 RepID=A0A7C8HDD4_9FIRM|nr:DNA gyrase subunit A [Defluviitalea raffinosedens]KAE9630263.1 DNA gyrase subunit A [Defluviitalea raffinosedens]MBZ4667647.1 gyrA [Defluviitaleaceae bacterium]
MEEKEFDKIIPVDIQEEMKRSYIDYAMSVIVSRALPDVRDGLKPVHRRILYAMNELHLSPDKAYKKSARIVGETMGKYHPHGDSSIYDAMVRLAQDFSIRYPLVDGHGNFGSVDGDSAAAMRYTEARLSKIAMELLADIEKETIDFVPNFDESLNEPSVLPARFPNLLVNGTSGIAVGMATNIPPHNLKEVINGVVKIIDNYVEYNRETDIEELLSIIKGPDFPTGAIILGRKGIEEAYRTGRGKIKVRAVADIEQISSSKQRIVVTEIPYMVNKARLIEKIADLVKEKKIEGISDLRDESDRKGMRIVIEIKKDYNANIILNQLYQNTQLQDIFGINMVALVNNEPKTLNLKDMLIHYLNHQKDVVTRRTQFDLRKAEERSHILEGLRIALDHIDEVISIIRSSASTQQAKERLIEAFALSDKQAQAIVDMRLRSLTGLEREKLEEEYRELQETIKELRAILGDEKRLYGVIKEELLIIRQKYGDERKTRIEMDSGELDVEDLIADEPNVITMTHLGYIKRLPLNTYKSQNRGGRGIIGMQTREEDFIEDLFIASTHHYILFFSNKGKVYRLKTYEIPEASRTARGTAIINLLQVDPDENITAVVPVKEYKEGTYLLMVTKKGLIKKTSIMEYENIRKGGLLAINLREDDELIQVKNIVDDEQIFIGTKNGQGILFSEKDVREIGRTGMGVRAMTLNDGDEIIGVGLISEGRDVLFVTEKGLGKRTDIGEFHLQKRGGKGIKTYRLTEKTGKIIGIKMVSEEEEIMMITSEGIIIRLHVAQISKTGRVTQGVKLMNLGENESVVAVAKVVEDENC